MNQVISSEATLVNGQPITTDTIPFIENGVQEAISNVIRGLLGTYNASDFIVLFGCVVTFPGSLSGTGSVTAGAVYYNGEVYTVPAIASIAIAGGQTLLFTNTEANGPVVNFEDGNPHYPHRIRQVQLVAGTTGGAGVPNYICDYTSSLVKQLDSLWIQNTDAARVILTHPSSGVTGKGFTCNYKIIGRDVVFQFEVAFTNGGAADFITLTVSPPISPILDNNGGACSVNLSTMGDSTGAVIQTDSTHGVFDIISSKPVTGNVLIQGEIRYQWR